MLTRATVERALNTAIDDHPRYKKHEPLVIPTAVMAPPVKPYALRVISFSLIPQNGSFAPKLVNDKTRFILMGDKFLFMYAQGMTTCETVKIFNELYFSAQ